MACLLELLKFFRLAVAVHIIVRIAFVRYKSIICSTFCDCSPNSAVVPISHQQKVLRIDPAKSWNGLAHNDETRQMFKSWIHFCLYAFYGTFFYSQNTNGEMRTTPPNTKKKHASPFWKSKAAFGVSYCSVLVILYRSTCCGSSIIDYTALSKTCSIV